MLWPPTRLFKSYSRYRRLRCDELTAVLSKEFSSCSVVLNYSTDSNLRVTIGTNSDIYFLQELKNEVAQVGTITAFETIHHWIEQSRSTLAPGEISSSEFASTGFLVISLKDFGHSLGSTIHKTCSRAVF